MMEPVRISSDVVELEDEIPESPMARPTTSRRVRARAATLPPKIQALLLRRAAAAD